MTAQHQVNSGTGSRLKPIGSVVHQNGKPAVYFDISQTLFNPAVIFTVVESDDLNPIKQYRFIPQHCDAGTRQQLLELSGSGIAFMVPEG